MIFDVVACNLLDGTFDFNTSICEQRLAILTKCFRIYLHRFARQQQIKHYKRRETRQTRNQQPATIQVEFATMKLQLEYNQYNVEITNRSVKVIIFESISAQCQSTLYTCKANQSIERLLTDIEFVRTLRMLKTQFQNRNNPKQSQKCSIEIQIVI